MQGKITIEQQQKVVQELRAPVDGPNAKGVPTLEQLKTLRLAEDLLEKMIRLEK